MEAQEQWTVVKETAAFVVCRHPTDEHRWLFIVAGERIESPEDNLNCTNCSDCHFCIDCTDCQHCTASVGCTSCDSCEECFNVSNACKKKGEHSVEGADKIFSNSVSTWYKKGRLYMALVGERFAGASFVPMVGCRRCNGIYLIGCSDCTECSGCVGCTKCSGCNNGFNLRECTDCSDCGDCTGCHLCVQCVCCRECTSCVACDGCSKCINCNKCKHSNGCTRCISVEDVEGVHSKAMMPYQDYIKLLSRTDNGQEHPHVD